MKKWTTGIIDSSHAAHERTTDRPCCDILPTLIRFQSIAVGLKTLNEFQKMLSVFFESKWGRSWGRSDLLRLLSVKDFANLTHSTSAKAIFTRLLLTTTTIGYTWPFNISWCLWTSPFCGHVSSSKYYNTPLSPSKCLYNMCHIHTIEALCLILLLLPAMFMRKKSIVGNTLTSRLNLTHGCGNHT